MANNPDPRVIPTFKAFVETLQQLGWIEGKNLELKILSSGNDDRRFAAFAAQLARENVDLIFTTGLGSTTAAKAATATIPIVFGSTANPVELGLVQSLAKPGGNVTGMAFFSLELGPKRLEILRELLPRATRIARLYSASNKYMAPEVAKEPAAAARALGFVLDHIAVSTPDDLEAAFKRAAALRADAVTIEPDAVFVSPKDRSRLAELAIAHRLPTMTPDARYVSSGALISYGENFEAMYRRAAVLVDRILRGAKPADIPVEKPTVVETAINLKTAKVLGVSVPEHLLLSADNVIRV